MSLRHGDSLGPKTALALGFAALAAYAFSQSFLGSLDRRMSISTMTQSGRGLSLFQALTTTPPAHGGRRLGTALLTPKALAGIDTLLVNSPLSALTKHEADVIARFVDGGGTLWLGFHDEESRQRLDAVVKAVDGDLPVGANKAFAAFTTEAVAAASPGGDPLPPLAAAETYAFYSPVVMDDALCARARLACFYRTWTHGAGRVVAVAGLPPLANAMLQRGDNGLLAARLAATGGTFGFDEYHHYFSDKSLADLLLEPTFTVPLVGLIAVILLFLAFGDDELRQDERETARPQAGAGRSYHELGAGVLAGVLTSPRRRGAALARQAGFLRRRYPVDGGLLDEGHGQDAPGSAADAGRAARALLRAHGQILRRQGRGQRS